MGLFEGGAAKPPAGGEPAPQLPRVGLLVLLGVVLLIAKAVGLFDRRQAPAGLAQDAQSAALERAARVQPAAIVALAPLAVTTRIVERPGTDVDLYPLSTMPISRWKSRTSCSPKRPFQGPRACSPVRSPRAPTVPI